jgi:hypothetical protein
MPRAATVPLSAAFLLLALDAAAQTAPPALRPERDVTITRGGAHPVPGMGRFEVREMVSAGTGRIRNENAGAVLVQDRRGLRSWQWNADAPPEARRVTETVLEADDLPLGYDELPREPDFVVTARGADRVAGLPCTIWHIRERDDAPEDGTTLCLSADGLLLRQVTARGGMRSGIEATRVEYGALDPALFEPPRGWPVQRRRADGSPAPPR